MNAADTKVIPGVTYRPGFVWSPDGMLTDLLPGPFAWRTCKLYGRTVKVPRGDMWYGDHPYTFGGHTFPARPLPPALVAMAIRCESVMPECRFDGALVNLYRDGQDSVSWHADDEADMGPDLVVASISLGATRRMRFRRKGEQVSAMASAVCPNKGAIDLEHGSLLVMGRGVQDDWEHCIPKTQRKVGPRVNITFRTTAR